MPFSIRPFRRFPVQCSVTYNAGPFLTLLLASCSGFWLLITLLVLSSSPACAEWVKVSNSDEAGKTVYVDPATIRRNSNLVTMWQFYDYETVQTVGGIRFLTAKEQWEFDCAEERSRVLALKEFSGNMGSGTVVYTNSQVGNWVSVMPGSMGQAVWKVACGKK
jgi:hypothetical protein